MKRILLFIATNAAVLLLLSITMQLLGIEGILDEQGVALDLNSLLVFSAVLGFGGSADPPAPVLFARRHGSP